MNIYSYKVNGQKHRFTQNRTKKNALRALEIVPFQISLGTTLRSNKIKEFPALRTTALLVLASLNRR